MTEKDRFGYIKGRYVLGSYQGLRKRRRHAQGTVMPDDAEVRPPDADVATGFTPGWIARTDRTQGHNRGVNPLATWKCGRRGGRPSQGRRMCGRRGGRPSPIKVEGLRKRRRHD